MLIDSKLRMAARIIAMKLLEIDGFLNIECDLETFYDDLENDINIELTAWGIFKFDKGFLLSFCESIASFSIMFLEIIPE